MFGLNFFLEDFWNGRLWRYFKNAGLPLFRSFFFISDYTGSLHEEMHYRVTLAYGLRICARTAENH
jgi:hypothetical protein